MILGPPRRGGVLLGAVPRRVRSLRGGARDLPHALRRSGLGDHGLSVVPGRCAHAARAACASCGERARVLLEEARARGDRYSIAFFQSGDCVLDALGRDEPRARLAGADGALSAFPTRTSRRCTSATWSRSCGCSSTRATARARGRRSTTRGRPAATSGFLSLEGIGVVLHYLRGCAALAAAETAPLGPARRSRSAAAPAARGGLAPRAGCVASACRPVRRSSLAITAGLHAPARRAELRSARARGAIAGFDAVDMALHRESARLCSASSARGGARSHRARAWMSEEAVQESDRAGAPGDGTRAVPDRRPQEPRPSLA